MSIPVGTDELRDAGLYDPTAPNAREKLNLLRLISARGGTIEEMRDARRPRNSSDWRPSFSSCETAAGSPSRRSPRSLVSS